MEIQEFQDFQNNQNATEVALKNIEEERQEQLIKLNDQNRRLSVFLTFFLTTFVVLFFAALLVVAFRSLREDLFASSPIVQIFTIAAPVLATLALSIYFNWERITSPILYRIQKILFYPVDFAFKVWSAEFQHDFERMEGFLRGEIERKQDQIKRYEDRLSSHIEHGRTVEKLLKERISAQDYSETVIRGLLNSVSEYIVFIDSNAMIPDYYSRNVIKLLGKEVRGDNFPDLARFSHQENINFMSFLGHVFDRDIEFHELTQFAPRISTYFDTQNQAMKVHWRYRPLYANNGQVLFLMAFGSENEFQSEKASIEFEKAISGVESYISEFSITKINTKNQSQPGIQIDQETIQDLKRLVAKSSDLNIKRVFNERLFKRPLKALISELENYAYQLAEQEQKEIEFDYFDSLNDRVDTDSFEKAMPVFKGLIQYLIKEDLESPSYRQAINKLDCGKLKFSLDCKEYGARGYFFKISIDGMGVSPMQIKSDLLKADLLQHFNDLSREELFSIYLSPELNQYYQSSYMGIKNKIACPTDLSKIKEYVEQLRGSLFLDSTEGVLTEFNLFIPESLK